MSITTTPNNHPDYSTTQLNPGDEAAPGTLGSGEDICEKCSGTGKLKGEGGKEKGQCPFCGGTGRVTRGIGGG